MDRVQLADLPDVLTVPEAGRVLRLSRNGAYAAVQAGEIPVIRLGRRMLVPRMALERLLDVPVHQRRQSEERCEPVAA